MKDFTAPEYIRPIVTDILTKWKFKDLRKWQPDAVYLEQRQPAPGCRHTCATNLFRFDVYTLYIMGSARALFRDLTDWTKAAETYEGELDEWSDRERDRVADAVKNELLTIFEKEAAA